MFNQLKTNSTRFALYRLKIQKLLFFLLWVLDTTSPLFTTNLSFITQFYLTLMHLCRMSSLLWFATNPIHTIIFVMFIYSSLMANLQLSDVLLMLNSGNLQSTTSRIFNITNFIELSRWKNGCNPASKKQKSSCEVSDKIYRFWDLYETIHSGIEALDFSKLSTKIGYFYSSIFCNWKAFYTWFYVTYSADPRLKN